MIKLTEDTQGIWTYANSLIDLIEFFDKVSEDDSGSYTGKSFEVRIFYLILVNNQNFFF